jgi:hypothetical protein
LRIVFTLLGSGAQSVRADGLVGCTTAGDGGIVLTSVVPVRRFADFVPLAR